MATLGANNEFDYARKRAQQREQTNLQTQRDALQRRQAQTGGGVSGALIKQESIAANESAQRLASENEGIDAAERAEARRLREIEEGRQFARSEREASQGFSREERLGSQGFGAEQSAIQRRFQSGEREATQGWQSGESAIQRRFQTGERVASEHNASGEAARIRDFQTAERIAAERNASGEAARIRDFQKELQTGQQAWATGERTAAEQNASGEAARIRDFQQQLATDQRQWTTAERIAAEQNASGEAARQRDLAYAQLTQQAAQFTEQMGLSRAEFEQQKAVDAVNEEIARKMLDQKGPLEQLFSGFGALNIFNPDTQANKGLTGGLGGGLGKLNPGNPESYFGRGGII